MDAVKWERLRSIYHSLLARSENERAGFLCEACGGDDALREEIESLLERDQHAGNFLEPPSSIAASQVFAAAHDHALLGRRIGMFTIGEVLGRGGMGAVYAAVQENPRRTVALKIVRSAPHLDPLTPRLLRREAQALARLDHPGIGAIHEAGAEDGWHYFAMERVDGVPLTQFASERNLAVPERLRLFAAVCDAVEYAHQRGVIHRDLKPSNILVTAEGKPKVLDFGLARITDASSDVATQATEAGAILGTLAYMSPEQVRGQPGELDVRSDVYSLGIILYELLTGNRPYEVSALPLPEAARIICEQSPPAPAAIVRDLRGDLDTIIRKSIEKEATRRYASVAALREDIERFLAQRPILARPASTAYQVRKFIARNRVSFALGSALLAIIIGSSFATAWLALRYAEQRDEAVSAKTRASEERDTAEQTAAFLAKLFVQADPSSQETAAPTARDLLDAGVVRLETELADKPLVRARLMTVIGVVYGKLADYPKALQLLRSAVEIVRRERGNDHADLIEPLAGLADALGRANQRREALEVLVEHLRICETRFGPRSQRVAQALTNLGEAHFYGSDHAAALSFFERSLELRRELFGEESEAVAGELTNIGYSLQNLRRFDEAEAALGKSLALKQRLGSEPFAVGQTLEALAHVAMGRNDPAAAERYLTQQIELYRKAFHDRHPQIAFALHNLAYVVAISRGPDVAEPIYRETLDRRRELYGEVHPDFAHTMSNLGVNQMLQGKFDEAIAIHTRVIEIRRALWGERSSLVGGSMQTLGETYRRAGCLAEAESLFRQSYDILSSNHGPTAHNNIPPVSGLAAIYRELDQLDDAAHWLEVLGSCFISKGNRSEASAAFREALEIDEQLFGVDHPRTIECAEKLRAAEEVE